MKNYAKYFTACFCFVVILCLSFTAHGLPVQPHLQRQGANLVRAAVQFTTQQYPKMLGPVRLS